MRYETVQEYEASEFKRFTGVRKETFTPILEAVIEQTCVFGRPSNLSFADHKKALREGETAFEIALVDATGCSVERPQKDNGDITAERRNDTLRRLN
jgi:hypothetical protein